MGEHGPDKFVNDGRFCIWTQLVLATTSVVLSSIGASADNDGHSNIPFFITGFILAPFHVVNVICKIVALSKLQKVTKTDILTLLRTHIAGKLWPITAHMGLVWCIPGMVLTGLGGLACDVGDKNVTTNANLCYYDATTDQAGVYKGLAIGLMVCHAVSFIWFLFSSCPVQGVEKEIKNDSKPPAAKPTTVTPAAAAPKTPDNKTKQGATASGSNSDSKIKSEQDKLEEKAKKLELKERELRLKEKALELEEKEIELRRREQAMAAGSSYFAPPSYVETTAFNLHSKDDLPPPV